MMSVIFHIGGIVSTKLTLGLDVVFMKFFQFFFGGLALFGRLFAVFGCFLGNNSGLYQCLFELLHECVKITEPGICQLENKLVCLEGPGVHNVGNVNVICSDY